MTINVYFRLRCQAQIRAILAPLLEASELGMVRPMQKFVLSACLLAAITAQRGRAEATDDRWWPTQAVPRTVVQTVSQHEFPEPRLAFQMMVQSIAGLAAKSVNENRGDELVWVDNGNIDLDDWLARWRTRHPQVKSSARLAPWELVDRFARVGIVKGYILYRTDSSRGELNSYRPSMDRSINVATSLAGLLDGVMVEENLEKQARMHGLKLLMDVREKSQAWCFQTYREQFNRRMLCTQDPQKPHVRDLAIAQRAFTLYGGDEPLRPAMAWLEPLSPILGWNGGDEFASTDLSTRFAHIQTATDWCMNLPVLMAGSEKIERKMTNWIAAPAIDWSDRRSAVSFVESDGDNVQWLQGNFFRGNRNYWGSPDRGRFPFGWSTCFAHLEQLCPPAIEYALATRTTNDSCIEWGGGYYYPDHFAQERKDRWELLARHAQRTWAQMKKTRTRIIGFNVAQHDSSDARRAYEVIAGQTDGLLGIFVFQYYPYEGGAGTTFWVKDGHGVELPVITARYSIWEHVNHRERSGTPAKIAREIRQTVAKSSSKPRYDWAIAHAWSRFRKAPGTDEEAENVPPAQTSVEKLRGYTPVTWCAERLREEIRVVSPEELLWRIRMEHNPAQTKQFMERLSSNFEFRIPNSK